MLERLRSFFGTLSEQPHSTAISADDPRVAAAALMFHVADADGIRNDAERKRLADILADTYALSGSELQHVMNAAEEADREAIDLFTFTSVLNRKLDEAAKVELIGILWEMVYADGELHELEDNIVWRVAELIGVSPRDRMLERQRVRNSRGHDGSVEND